jgi:hypothetical protein
MKGLMLFSATGDRLEPVLGPQRSHQASTSAVMAAKGWMVIVRPGWQQGPYGMMNDKHWTRTHMMDKEQGVPVEGHTLPYFYGYAIYALLSVLTKSQCIADTERVWRYALEV